MDGDLDKVKIMKKRSQIENLGKRLFQAPKGSRTDELGHG